MSRLKVSRDGMMTLHGGRHCRRRRRLRRFRSSPPELAYIPNRSLHAAVARFTGGLSPAALSEAYLDWATHLANAPGKRLQLTEKAVRKAMRFARYAYQYAIDAKTPENCIVPLPQDHRNAVLASTCLPLLM
jgi:polyhydroxyalkanoate synthase subunit PhaC